MVAVSLPWALGSQGSWQEEKAVDLEAKAMDLEGQVMISCGRLRRFSGRRILKCVNITR